MSDEQTDVPSPVRERGRSVDGPFALCTVGVLACLVVAVHGLRLIRQRVAVTCPDGTAPPFGTTDVACFAHPQAGAGVTIICFAVAITVVLLMLSSLIGAVLERRQL